MTKRKTLGPLDEYGMHTVVETDDASPQSPEVTEPHTDTPEAPKDDEPQGPLPGDADYDWSAHYGEDVELYRHTFRDGTVVALRPFGAVFSKTLLWKLRNAEATTEVEFTTIMRGGCPAVDVVLDRVAGAVIDSDDYEYDPIDDLFQSWMKAGTSTTPESNDGLSLGKSDS
ncbi:hypothetical protein [Mycobacteroides abscessus]|uniref:hypothetical protein n=1 Tax=Mycobacteroides abscessus TaxID=36809 RepID=UPI0009CBF6E5|nr:hypothetical protein [Mycobacteroides abscessus]SKI75369.1 Uncharacterised protein [Mycobacteroides abscessus subsp. massiliense]SKM56113.1 Uncharacterised protein [Mycobacteroides abscessus subsp. massiliense]SKP98451.1 Uncharacterised protein [Mycobacteroides abscessus subsp. massiliense]SKQ07570.1 Uncharacterised protein [Mycobacteroides abscessus subsp. massiliense]SLL01473.1 Uncharacterised protein [Mycobacteroides abscessus subsp. massiliense]